MTTKQILVCYIAPLSKDVEDLVSLYDNHLSENGQQLS